MTRNIEIKAGNGCKNYAVGEKGKLKRDLHPFWENHMPPLSSLERSPLVFPTMGKLKYTEGNEFTRNVRIR